MQVAKWGDDLVVRLPRYLVDVMKLEEGDEVDLDVTHVRKRRALSDEEYELMWENVRAIQRPFPLDYKFSREEANER